MSGPDPIKVKGLVEFQRALKQIDGESQKQLRVALNQAAELVAASARRKVPSRTGRAASSVRAMSSQREARVMGGSKKVPYYGWLEFGGTVGRGRVASHIAKKKAVTDGRVHRPYITGGRYIYPGFTANRAEVLAALEAALSELVQRAGLEVT